MPNLEAYNLSLLQGFKNIVDDTIVNGESLNSLAKDLKEKILEISESTDVKGHGARLKTGALKKCPSCKETMRKENKGNEEYVWHCLSCHYSEYIGDKL